MRALAGAALVALAVAGCGSSRSGASASLGIASASPCKTSASPSHASATPSAPESGGFSVVISQGQTIQRQVTVNPQQLLFAVQVAWNQGDVQLSLITPSGKVYDRTTTDPNANHHVQVNAESFAIHNPESGRWTIQLFGASIRASGLQVGVSLTQMPLSDFAPVAVFNASTDRGVAPLAVQFSGQADGFNGATITSYRWDFGDCSPLESAVNVTHVSKPQAATRSLSRPQTPTTRSTVRLGTYLSLRTTTRLPRLSFGPPWMPRSQTRSPLTPSPRTMSTARSPAMRGTLGTAPRRAD
jgi:hypothetical protein